jgi:RND family efflux transporter MFP subunit
MDTSKLQLLFAKIINSIKNVLINLYGKIAGKVAPWLKKIIAWAKQKPKQAILVLIILIAAYQTVKYFIPKSDGSKNQVQTVTTMLIEQKDYPIIVEATGNTISSHIVDIRPQVTNIVAKVHIKEGQDVKAGDILFTLDDRADRANYEKAKALADDAQRQAKRARDLVAQNFISQAAADTAIANANSTIAAARAAEVQLSYDTIKSPIDGTAGVINLFPGALVQPGTVVSTATTATSTTSIGAMVTITQLDPINVQFTIPEKLASGLSEIVRSPEGLTIEAQLANGEKRSGKVIVIDNQVDVSIGAVKAKAQIQNTDRKLIPGQFVQVTLNTNTLKDALVVPIQAIVTNQKGSFLYVVGEEDKVSLKPIKIISQAAGFAAISGANAGDRIVIEGKQNLRPGGKVREAKPAAEKKS